MLAALDWVTEQADALGISVVNLSLGVPGINETDDLSARQLQPNLHRRLVTLNERRVAVVVAAGVFVVMKVVPPVTEFQSIKTTIRKVAQSNPATVEDARRAFDRQRIADPTIRAVTGDDLAVTKEGGRVVIKVKYDKELHMAGPVSLLIRYEASSD